MSSNKNGKKIRNILVIYYNMAKSLNKNGERLVGDIGLDK
jgi:hypothetical protein